MRNFHQRTSVLLFLFVGVSISLPIWGNDDCINAVLIGPGTVMGSTTGANSDGDAGCGLSGSSPDVWYEYAPTDDFIVTIDTCGSGYDTVLSVHTACPGTTADQVACNDDVCGVQSTVQVIVSMGTTYYIRVSGYNNAEGSFSLTLSESPVGAPGSGPDVVYTDCQSISHYGPVGTTHAYSLGSFTCNIGDQNLQWGSTTPLLAMNAYRLNDGRLEQIGMSWVKNGTGAAVGNGCGLPCNGQGGSVLGAGCLDIYGSGFNGIQGILGPRSDVNAFTGAYPGESGAAATAVSERLQVDQSDLTPTTNLYFVEGVYVAPDDAAAGNALNNASYKRVSVNPQNFEMSPEGSMFETIPAIYAWADHGLGVGMPDPSVTIIEADIPSEGRFFLATKVTDLGGGQYRYDYAVFNLNSHQSADEFVVPIAPGTVVTNTGFHDVDYHSGEPYDNTDWNITVGANSVSWSSPQTFAQNPDTNALRWGTMYNFWFEANSAPVATNVTLGLFRPGPEDALDIVSMGPDAPVGIDFVRGDCNGDGSTNIADVIFALGYLFPASPPAPALDCADACDGNDDGQLDVSDPITLLNGLFAGGTIGAPNPACGLDPTSDVLDCSTFPSCP